MRGLKWRRIKRWQKVLAIFLVIFVTFGLTMGRNVFASLFGNSNVGVNSSTINLDAGLVGRWKFDGNAKDATPNSNNCTATGSVTAATDRQGQSNKAYSFNGSSYYTCGTTNLPAIDAPQSASAWFNTSSVGSFMNLVVLNRSNNAANQLVLNSSGHVAMTRWSGGVSVAGTASISNGDWHLATYTFDGTTAKVYLDGQLDNSATPTLQTGAPTNLYMGTYGGGEYFNGSMDDARVYNRSLSADEVQALYDQYDAGLQVGSSQTDLLGWWKMDGNAKDATPYGNDGTVSGATLTTDRFGHANSAYNFVQASSQKITVSTSQTVNGSFSIGAWVKPSDTGSNRGIAGSRGGSLFDMKLDGGTTIHGDIGDGSSWLTTSADASFSYSAGEWIHVMYVVTPSGYTIYANGNQVGANSFSGTPLLYNSSNDLTIGAVGPSSGEYFNGSIDDVRIYGRAITPEEVDAIYNSSQVVATSINQNLVGQWDFSGNGHDNTPYSHNATVNGATLTTDRKGYANDAYSFNGSTDYLSTSLPTTSTASVALSAWFKTNDYTQDRQVIVYNGNGGGSGYGVTVNNESQNTGEIRVLYGGITWFNTGVTVTDTNWHHIVLNVMSDSHPVVYLDGTQIYSGGTSTPNAPSGNMGIGTDFSGTGTPFFDGSIDDVRVWSRVLTAVEVRQLYGQ